MKKWVKIKSDLVFDSKYFKVRQDLVKLPDGRTKVWNYWDSRDSSMVIGIYDGKLILIKQYRYLVNNVVLEFPSGGLNPGENPKTAAKREFLEETGYQCQNLTKLGSFYETYGQLNRQIHLFFSNNVKKSRKNVSTDDIEEDISVKLLEFDDVVKSALDNKIVAMGSSLAILLLKEKISCGEIKI